MPEDNHVTRALPQTPQETPKKTTSMKRPPSVKIHLMRDALGVECKNS